eukprot:1515547-Pyramimonas_sp.AAC.1
MARDGLELDQADQGVHLSGAGVDGHDDGWRRRDACVWTFSGSPRVVQDLSHLVVSGLVGEGESRRGVVDGPDSYKGPRAYRDGRS